ncbi:MAG: hypothetical protein NFCOHLIN_00146 [Gammaproteobacteria bacterium]|nr:hypothetical protein [Gammaproteobacteria bacterium]
MPEYRDLLPLLAMTLSLVLMACSKKEAAAPETGAAAPAESPLPAEPIAAQPPPSATGTLPAAQTAPAAGTAPVAAAQTEPPPAMAAAPAKPIDGAVIAQGICMACHQAGMNGAPKFANKVAWATRIAQGREKLYEHSIKGLRGMPPRGGNPNLTDDEVKAAVDYMVKAAGGYKE